MMKRQTGIISTLTYGRFSTPQSKETVDLVKIDFRMDVARALLPVIANEVGQEWST